MSEQSEKLYRTNAMRLENISTAMLFVCSAILFGLSPLKPEELDWILKLVLYCVAIALPASALGFMIKLEREYFGKSLFNSEIAKKYLDSQFFTSDNFKMLGTELFSSNYKSTSEYVSVIDVILFLVGMGIMAGITGLSLVFFRFSFGHGIVFIVIAIFSWMFYIKLSKLVDEELSKEVEPSQQNNSDAEINR